MIAYFASLLFGAADAAFSTQVSQVRSEDRMQYYCISLEADYLQIYSILGHLFVGGKLVTSFAILQLFQNLGLGPLLLLSTYL